MRFRDSRASTIEMIETVCLLLSSGAVFLQIWILLSGFESFFKGQYDHLGASVILSGVALLVCGLAAWTTTLNFYKNGEKGN